MHTQDNLKLSPTRPCVYLLAQVQDVGDVLVRDLHSHGDLSSQLDLCFDLLRQDV